ncbi:MULTISPECIES: methyltransferase domain-containing protein [unclassified Dyella]|uniref:class I SAM-dependent methyltransferase n=1 Tax=unclassified Dyella TaxID=2634549 RepID=UPI000C8148D8|nr:MULTISPECIES: methyltransferase domain-containing protein [unclassified Dyella]MDR3445283.1 methyltransferase domain-containing protein [Dyella sp.]PMQ07170.1 Glycine/sarcosine/dimethylglycine N-methyltransferase [Dyella sp. AD56]
MPTLAPTRSRAENVNRINRSFYESLWSGARLVEPNRFNTWPLVSKLVAQAPRRLEVAPGLRPRLPLDDTCFMDLSGAAIAALRTRNAMATRGSITALPYADASFDLVCALDILEHVVDDDGALSELTRVADPRAALLLSVPLHADAWTSFDDFVGHYRRYEPGDIAARLATHGWRIEQSAVYGMQPSSPTLLALGEKYLTQHRERALWWYNRVFMPIGLRLQKPLSWQPGLVPSTGVDEVLLLCRRT